MRDLIAALDQLIIVSNVMAGGTGIDEIYLHPKVFHEVLRCGVGEIVRTRLTHEIRRVIYKGVDLKEGRAGLPCPQMRY